MSSTTTKGIQGPYQRNPKKCCIGRGLDNCHHEFCHPGGSLHGRHHGRWPQALNSRPTFKQWFREHWVDHLMLGVLSFGCLMVLLFAPAYMARYRLFPLYNFHGDIADPSIAYPKRQEIVPIYASILLSIFTPLFLYLVIFAFVRSFWDLNNAILGTFYALLSATIFQLILKKLIGGLRPHFLDLCRPSPLISTDAPQGFAKLYHSTKICTGEKSKDFWEAMESFPSGHTTAAFAAAIFMTLYLNAKLKLLSNYQPQLWKLLITMLPLLGAFIMGGTLTIDGYHQPSDIVAGALIGTVFAFVAYRMMYAAIWDFRFNHIPLSRHHGFQYSAGDGKYASFYDTVLTQKAGWGTQGMYCLSGAPEDMWQHQGALDGPMFQNLQRELEEGKRDGDRNGNVTGGGYGGAGRGENGGSKRGNGYGARSANGGAASGGNNTAAGVEGGNAGGGGTGKGAGGGTETEEVVVTRSNGNPGTEGNIGIAH